MAILHTSDGKFIVSGGVQFLRQYIAGDTAEPVALDFDATALCLAAAGDILAVGCDDGSVKLFSTASHDFLRDVYGGSTPVRSLAFNSDGKWLAISTHEKSVLVSLEDINNLKTISKPSRHLSWHPTEELVVVSGQDSTLYYFEGGELKPRIEGVLPAVDLADSRSTAAVWSPSGDCFGVPAKSLDFVIYDRQQALEMCRLVHKEPIIMSQWSPNGRYIACLLDSGSIYIWNVPDRSTIAIKKLEGCASFTWHPHDNIISYLSATGNMEKFIAVPDNHPTPFGEVVVEQKRGRPDDEEVLILSDEEAEEAGEDDVSDLFDAPAPKRIRMEQAFQPGSSPWYNRKRIMCTNYVGYVWTTYQDSEHNTITISFFDQGTHRDAHFEDESMYDLAALSDRATLFANSKSGKVFMRFHDSRLDSWEFQCSEPIRAIATSTKIAVLCTDSGIVHTLSVYGNSLSVTRESRDSVLTCAAHENLLMIVRSGNSGPSYTLEDPVTQRYYQKNDAVDVSPHASLTTLFFNDNGDPCVGTSTGTLSTLVHWRDPLQARWVPVFDSKSHWPVGILGSELLCVLLKNQRSFPTVPLPVTSQVPLKIPGLAGHEGEYILRNLTHQQAHARGAEQTEEDQAAFAEQLADSESQLNMLLLKQLQAACNDNRPNRCLAIASLITSEEALGIAAQIAVRYNLHSVAERIQG